MNYLAILFLTVLVYLSSSTTNQAGFFTLAFLKALIILWIFMDLRLAKTWGFALSLGLGLFFIVIS